MGAVAVASGAGAYVAVSSPAAEGIFALAVIAAVGLCAAGITLGRLDAVLWGAGGLAAVYVGSLLYRSAPPDPWCPLIATALLLCVELASWSIDSRRRGADDLTVHAGRFLSIVLQAAAAVALVLVVQTASQFGRGGTASAALATVAVLAGAGAICLLMFRSRTFVG